MENRITREQFIEWIESQPQEKIVSILDYGATFLDVKHRKNHIINQMIAQRKIFDASEIEYEVDIEKCSLYDMYTCTLVGSGRCQKCEGLIGGGIEYENDLEL